MLLKQWPTGAASGGCRGTRRGESRGWGPVWWRGKKTLKCTLTVIISKPQLADFISLFHVYLQTFVFSVICFKFCVCALGCVLVLTERSQSLLCLVRARLGSLLERKRRIQFTFTHKLIRTVWTHSIRTLRRKRAEIAWTVCLLSEHVRRLRSEQNACNALRAARPL